MLFYNVLYFMIIHCTIFYFITVDLISCSVVCTFQVNVTSQTTVKTCKKTFKAVPPPAADSCHFRHIFHTIHLQSFWYSARRSTSTVLIRSWAPHSSRSQHCYSVLHLHIYVRNLFNFTSYWFTSFKWIFLNDSMGI